MRYTALCIFFLISLRLQAQDNSAPSGVLLDTLSLPATLQEEYEFIPAEDNPLLIEDRLKCLQKTIPLTYNDRVHGFIDFFTVRNREYTRTMLRKQSVYFPLFEKYLKEYGLPEELKYLSIIESALNPKAISPARAVGLWQFMAPTGRYFGLHQDWYVDERMDPEASTRAACLYLKQLYSMFGDWQFAIAAYNSGPGNIKKAIRRSGYKKSFWQVFPYMLRETRGYVPQFIAIIYAMNYAEEHNIYEPQRESLAPFDTLLLRQYLHLGTFAGLTKTCLDDLEQLNPSLLRKVVPEALRPFELRIPVASKAALSEDRRRILDSSSRVGQKELEVLARNSAGSTYGREKVTYTVRSGDVLGSIAGRYRVRVSDIQQWNGLSGTRIREGQRLVIWKPASPPTVTARFQPLPSGNVYIVQPGDTLWDIARKFQGLSVEKLKTLNNLKSNTLQPGQRLVVGG
jgi:membrane-bound lytic murein transglycosylase D